MHGLLHAAFDALLPPELEAYACVLRLQLPALLSCCGDKRALQRMLSKQVGIGQLGTRQHAVLLIQRLAAFTSDAPARCVMLTESPAPWSIDTPYPREQPATWKIEKPPHLSGRRQENRLDSLKNEVRIYYNVKVPAQPPGSLDVALMKRSPLSLSPNVDVVKPGQRVSDHS